ncbi:MAG: PAS domain S-box protein, partial [Armatimonadota bacterium]|nr:PAS domain S-box protein [Armatimonadota bacterium]
HELERRVEERTAELWKMQERFRGIYESSKDAIVYSTPDGVLIDVNAAFARLAGYSREEIITAKKYQDFTPDEYHALEAEIVANVLRTGEPAEYEKEYVRKDGSRVPVSLTVFVVRDSEGHTTGLAALVKDITERKQAEAALRKKTAHLELLQGIAVAANEASTLEEAAQRCLDKVCAATGWPVGHLYLVEESSRELVPTVLWHLDDSALFEPFRRVTEETRLTAGVGLPGRVFESGKPVWVRHIAQELVFVRAALAADLGVKAGFGFPILVGAEVAGVLEFFTREVVAPDESLLEVMTHLGTQLGQVVERQRAQAALRESEERARTQYKSFPVPTYTWQQLGDDFVLVDYNDAATTITQGSIRNFVGGSASQMFAEDPDIVDDLRRCLDLKTSVKREMTHRLATTGEVKDLAVTYVFVPPDLVMVHTEDVSERKRAEAALRASELKFRSLVEAASDAIVLCDGDGIILSWNPSACRMFGYTAEEALMQPLCDVLMPERYRPAHCRGIERLKAGGKPRILGKTLELYGLRKDGSEFPLELSLDSWKTPEGVFYSGMMRDVTERKRTEDERTRLIHEQVARAEAEAAERRSAFLAQASALLFSSLDYEVTLRNLSDLVVPTLADWYAVDMAEADGTTCRLALAHVDPQKVELVRDLEQRYPPDRESPRGIFYVLRTGQTDFYPEIPDDLLTGSARDEEHLRLMRELGLKSAIIVPLIARERTLGAITLVSAESGRRYTEADRLLAEDLARRAALAVDNARLFREAQEANRAKDEFLAMLSHELRTPLTSMLGWAQLLRSGKLDKETSERALETIERNTKAQAQLIEDLLDLSRIITGKLRLEVRPTELAPVIEAALDAARPAADAKNIQLQLVINPNVGLVPGDADRLQQIVWNLLSNAIKFTPKGGRVEVRLERVNSQAAITISDTGQGINLEFLPFVFDRFRQADMGLTRRHGGLGLGLAIVKHLVELHGGTVHADSPGEGGGSTFTVKIPLIPVRAGQAEAPGEPHAQRTGAAPYQPPTISLKGVRVLLVDDEADARELLTTILEGAGAEVRTAGSSPQALEVFEALEQWRPDVLVSDIGMPSQDGYSLIRRVRSLPPERGGQIPAVALTAYARAEDRLRALSAGYQMHVPKPVEPNELPLVVASLVGRA